MPEFTKQLTIAIIDDDDGVLDSLIMSLGLLHVVKGFRDAESFLEALSENSFDYAILDVNLPGMNGWQVLNTLRTAQTPTKVIMISGRHLDVDEAIAAGAFNALQKPIATRKLLDVIQ